MNIKNVFLILFVLILAALSFSCKAKPTEIPVIETKINGKVLDKDNNNAIVGAQVTTNPTTSSVTTDASGSYTIADVKAGQYVVSASKDGYKLNAISIVVVEGKTASADIQLAKTEPTKIAGKVFDKDNNAVIAGAQVTTNPVTSSVTTDASGNYTITDVEAGQYVVTASKSGYKTSSTNVNIQEGKTSSADIQLEKLLPSLSVNTTALDFGTSQTSLTFSISNETQFGTLDWLITKTADWLTVSSVQGNSTTGTTLITVTVNRSGLSFGNYSTILSITSNGGNKNITVALTVPNLNAPQLTVNPLLLDFGETTTSLPFNINNTGTGNLTWSVSSPQNWISVSPLNDSTKTETDVVNVTVNRSGLNAGSYTGQVGVSSNAGNQTVTVQIKVPLPPTLSLSTMQLDFGSTLSNLSFTISNSGTGTLNWSISSNQTWLTVSPASGTNQSSVNVFVNRDGISAGNYNGVLSISANGGNSSVNVTMSIPAPSNPTAVTLNTPTNITTSSVDLSWTQNSDANFKQYEVYKSATAGFTPSSSTLVQTIINKSTISTTVTGLSVGTTYYFKIRVINTNNLSSDSNERNVTTTSTIPITGLVAYYPFNGNSNDESGNGNNGIVNNVALATDKFGKLNSAYRFGGVSNKGWIRVPNSPTLQFSSSFSMSVWVRMENTRGSYNGAGDTVSCIFAKDNDAYTFTDIHYNGTRFLVAAGINAFSTPKIVITNTLSNFEIGQWIHFVFVASVNSASFYVNGQLIQTQNGTVDMTGTNSRDLYFGAFSNAIYPFNGCLDNIRIYNRALTQQEITYLYNE